MFLLQVAGNDYCGLLDDTNGVFGNFIDKLTAMAAEYRANCEFDVCVNMDDAMLAKKMACGTLQTFAAVAFDKGYGQLDWRTAAGCGKFIILTGALM